jgi:hypothetical protein
MNVPTMPAWVRMGVPEQALREICREDGCPETIGQRENRVGCVRAGSATAGENRGCVGVVENGHCLAEPIGVGANPLSGVWFRSVGRPRRGATLDVAGHLDERRTRARSCGVEGRPDRSREIARRLDARPVDVDRVGEGSVIEVLKRGFSTLSGRVADENY